ncbi:MAG: TIGR02757 family protein [Thermodesulfovibrionales bacterium]|nr:TIGR02757 family protein [Thermodesulfovibrionales bacterium]
MKDLMSILDSLYRDYDFKGRIKHDPIKFPHSYKDKGDIEVSGLIASSLAYGRVDLFMPVIEKILSQMGQSPCGFLRDFNIKKHGCLFHGVKYRFQTERDIIALLYVISEILKREGSIYHLFMRFYKDDDSNTGSALSGMVGYILKIDTKGVYYGRDISPGGLIQLFPSPARGGACKRENLFLRWMVRDKDMDFGIWKGIPKSRLVIPLDTHIKRVSLCLGLTKRKTADWKTAVEITENLKKLDPLDPLKYDFSLCHRGISGVCGSAACLSCSLKRKAA